MGTASPHVTPVPATSPDLSVAGPPFALQIEVTSSCNLRCTMCPLTSGGTASNIDPGDIGEAEWATALALAVEARQVYVAGFGEPFSNRRCVELLHALDATGVVLSLATNGVAVTDGIARQLAGMEHLIHINVSIDSPDPDCYRRIRGGSLQRALRGLGRIMDAFDDPNRVSVSSVAMVENVETLRQFPALLESMGVRHYLIQGLWEYNEYCREHGLSGRHELRNAFDDIVADGARRGIEVQLSLGDRVLVEMEDPKRTAQRYYAVPSPADGAERTRQCMLPWELPYLDKDGRVFSCCYAASVGAAELGRVGEATFEEIWQSPAYRRFRNGLLEGSTMAAVCRGCTAVPLGRHPLVDYAAVVDEVSLEGGRRARVLARNVGAAPWAGGSVLVGTCRPRDCASPLARPSWRNHDRPCAFSEAVVAPGERATFEFEIAVEHHGVRGHFALVAEGVCWLPGSEFSLP